MVGEAHMPPVYVMRAEPSFAGNEPATVVVPRRPVAAVASSVRIASPTFAASATTFTVAGVKKQTRGQTFVNEAVQLTWVAVDARQSPESSSSGSVWFVNVNETGKFQVWKLGSQRPVAVPLHVSAVTGIRPSVLPAVPLNAEVGLVPGSPHVPANGNAGL